MIASWRGIAVLAAVAAVLAAALLVDLARTPAPADRRLVHKDVAAVQRLAWGDLVATRTGDTWKAGDVILDRDAIADVLRTLEAATWHRRGGTPGAIHATLDVDQTHIGIADPLPGADQTWVVVDGTPLLVDAWVARALVPGALALHVRHPFAAAARANRIALHVPDLELIGHPRRLGGKQLADASAVRALEQALADVETTPAPQPSAGPSSVALDGDTTLVGGACGDDLASAGPYGPSCIGHAAWDRVAAAAEAVQVDLHPVTAVPKTIVLPDGAIDAHETAAAALVHALVTPGVVADSTAKPLRTLTIDGTPLDVLPTDAVRRASDGTVLTIAHDDWLALQRPAAAWADPTRWSEDASAVSTIAIGGTTYHRGAVLGEWTPATPLAAASLDELATALAHVQARDAGAATPPMVPAAATPHAITVTLAPPVGAAQTHTLALGAACAGRIDGTPVTFEPATCTALERALSPHK
ncbi:MAG: hypothetical protein JO257_30860 [Deltaproteobacteria bacterium]|nr:hypothetical protein [Deltaproteobacteria bacterium]